MLRRIAQLGLAFMLATGLLLGWFLWRGDTIVSLGRPELQQTIALGFPVEKTALAVFRVRLSDPSVLLRESSDRLGLTAAAEVGLQGAGPPAKGTVELSCRIRYEAAKGSFYADDPRVERLTLDGHPHGLIESTAEALTGIVAGLLARSPIYTLPAAGLQHSVATLVLKDVRVRDGKLRLTLGLASAAGR
jgi:hypothetical protein